MRNLIPYCIQEHYQQGRNAGEFEALTMFVDVSGFTPMTQALMKHGHEGAEILATVMNDIFDALVNAVYRRGGFVSTFAGDAFTAIFPFKEDIIPTDELIVHVLACVKTFQVLFHRHGIQTTPQGQFPLQFRVGLSAGKVDWGIVGDADKAYFFRGAAVDGCAASEHQAEKGDVIFDKNVAQRLRHVSGASESAQYIRSIQVDHLPGGFYRIKKLSELLCEEFSPPRLPGSPELDPEVLARFFPDTLIDLTQIGEFRRVVSIFISFAGIASVKELNDWVCVLLNNINTFGGYFNRISFGDKGGFVLCGFGAPISYENTMDRALDFILAVKEDLKGLQQLSGLKFRAGITYGMAYAGIAGGQRRCEYTYHGEVVNLAARFMMKADWGEIFVSDVVRSKAPKFHIVYKGDFMYKGIAEAVPSYLLIGRKRIIRQQIFTEIMVGRRQELQRLQQFAAPIFQHKFAGIVCLYGEAGSGKSRLAYALLEALGEQHGVAWFTCPADPILRKSFNPFISCLMLYFEQSSDSSEAENLRRFEERYQMLIEALSPPPGPRPEGEGKSSPLLAGEGPGVRSELLRTKSVIGAQVGLFWKDSLWEQLDAKGKYENTLSAIKNFFLAHSLLHPVVIELEDGQWLDSDSIILLQTLIHNVGHYPFLILSTLRYGDYGNKPCLLDFAELAQQNIPHEEIELNDFSETDLRHFAEHHLGGTIDEQLYAVLAEKTNGNPFFAEQLLHYFVENGCVERKGELWQVKAVDTKLPDTINAVLMARIDRLTERVKEAVKAAAVLGREFDIILLSAILKKDVLSQVRIVRKEQIWEEVQELLYMFKHALLRDIAYEMQLKARRTELHQLTAEAMEDLYATHLATRYADLAYHYEKADIRDKAIEYLEKAGDEAKAQYHNQQALTFYDRLLSQLQDVFGFPELGINTLLKKAEILEITGDWQACRQVTEEALLFAEQLGDVRLTGEAKLTLGVIFERTGEYDKGMAYLQQAQEHFELVGERVGLGGVHTNMGCFHWQKGNYDAAMLCYAKALASAEEVGDRSQVAKNANNIGVLYDIQGRYDSAMTWYNKGLQLSREIGDKQEQSRVLNNMGECHRETLGDYVSAMDFYQQALAIAEELGDTLQISTTLGNVGHVYKAQGNENGALNSYNRAITIARELESTYYLGEYLLGKAEVLFSLQRYEDAQKVNAEGLRMVEELERKECIFQGKLLSARLEFVLGNRDAPQRLTAMLQETQDDSEIALLHYELWKMTDDEANRQTALKHYQTLYETTAHADYKKRIEELQKNA